MKAYQATLTNQADDTECVNACIVPQKSETRLGQADIRLIAYKSWQKHLDGEGAIARLKAVLTKEQQIELANVRAVADAQYIKQNNIPIVISKDDTPIDFANASIIDVEYPVIEPPVEE